MLCNGIDLCKSGLRRVGGAMIVLAAMTSASVPSLAQQKTPLRVAYIPVITWLPALVAKDEGIFDQNGLDVTFTKFPTIVNLPPTLGRQFDLVPTTADPDELARTVDVLGDFDSWS